MRALSQVGGVDGLGRWVRSLLDELGWEVVDFSLLLYRCPVQVVRDTDSHPNRRLVKTQVQ